MSYCIHDVFKAKAMQRTKFTWKGRYAAATQEKDGQEVWQNEHDAVWHLFSGINANTNKTTVISDSQRDEYQAIR